MSEQTSLFAGEQTCEYRRDTYSETGRYWFMRCSLCNQQSNEHLIMNDYWHYCCQCGARIVRKEGSEEWQRRKERGEV